MPTSNRPVAVLVMAILNIVFGAIGCLVNGCCLCGLPLLPNLAAASKNAPNPDLEMLAAAYQDLPVWRASALGISGLDLALAAMLLIAGIGLIAMRPWGRITSILYGVLRGLAEILGTGIWIFYVEPAGQDWQIVYMQKHPNAAKLFGTGFSGQYINGALAAAYALALLIVMSLPSVKASFASRSATSEMEDYYRAPPDVDVGQ
jgi:hypothetical protein